MNILIAEDDPDIGRLLGEILEEYGHQCTLAENGEVAKRMLEEGGVFDLLISDFRMPKMNGTELLEWCRGAGIKFPVIFVTGNQELITKEKIALGDCCADLLRKPIGIAQLMKAVDEAMARSHAIHCPPDKEGK